MVTSSRRPPSTLAFLGTCRGSAEMGGDGRKSAQKVSEGRESTCKVVEGSGRACTFQRSTKIERRIISALKSIASLLRTCVIRVQFERHLGVTRALSGRKSVF